LKLGTSSYAGKEIKKTAVIHTNDPANAEFTLTLFGQIDKFVDLEPSYVRLTGYAGSQISVPVTIIPSARYPFKIIDVTSRAERFFKYTLTERKPGEGGGYTLLIENLKMDKGRYMDLLTLTTDSQIQPKIIVRVYGNIMEPEKKS
jgi:hypothetical protein